MSLVELLLIAVGLSMDALAVSICKGMVLNGTKLKNAIIMGLFFGGFHGIMPILGYLLGTQFNEILNNVDHWIAFILLAFIGGKMMVKALIADKDSCEIQKNISISDLVMLSIATSIDVLAVGVSFAFLKVAIIEAAIVIAVVTFIISAIGVYLGKSCGTSLGKWAEVTGGIVLIIIGIKILLEGLF